jgi:osmoprotectant transport system permease protein
VGEEAEPGVILADAFSPGTFVDAFRFVGNNAHLILVKTGEQLEVSAAALGLSLLIAIPLGLWLGHVRRGSFFAINVSNIGRALPSLVIVAIGVAFVDIGFKTVTLALLVLAVPPVLTNTYVAISEVDLDAIEAARGMGMTPLQVLLRVEAPLALPLIFAGIQTATVYVVATATLAALAGGGGLGDIIFDQASYRLEGVVGAAYCVSALALLADLAIGLLQRAVTPRGLRKRHTLEPEIVSPVMSAE